MKIEKAVCPHCGGPIEIGSRKIIKCEYCGMPIVISDLEIDKSDYNGFEGTIPKVEKRSYETPQNNRIEKKPKKHSYWTPVGFRTKTPWKMFCASLFYISALAYVEGGIGGIISFALFYFITAQVIFSWKPFEDHLPGLKTKNLFIRIISKAGYIFVAFIILSIMVVVFSEF